MGSDTVKVGEMKKIVVGVRVRRIFDQRKFADRFSIRINKSTMYDALVYDGGSEPLAVKARQRKDRIGRRSNFSRILLVSLSHSRSSLILTHLRGIS